MLIAFLGSRGSGKTTIARETYHKFDTYGMQYIRHDAWLNGQKGWAIKLFYAFYLWRFFVPRVLRVYGQEFLDALIRSPWSVNIYTLYFPLILSYNFEKLSGNTSNILVYDTDILRPFTEQVLEDDFNLSETLDFFEDFVLPKVGQILFVRVDTPSEEAVNRWVLRDDLEVSGVEKEKVRAKKRAVECAQQKVIDSLTTLPTVSIIRLSGVEQPQVNATYLLAYVSECLNDVKCKKRIIEKPCA